MILTVKHHLQYHCAIPTDLNPVMEYMPKYRIFTIGHGGRSLEEVADQLKKQGIEFVVDVRSQPYSRYQPDFSKEALAQHLARFGLRYVFMGDQLGGRPEDPTCYTDSGNVDYAECRSRPWFREGIQRIKTACERGYRLVLICSEGNPENCHRTALVGRELDREGLEVVHLMPDGSSRLQSEVMLARDEGNLRLPLSEFGPVSTKPITGRGNN